MLKLALWTLLAALCASCMAQGVPGFSYLKPGTPEVGCVKNLCLIYHGQKTRPTWTKQALMPYVAHVDDQGEPQDWMFDSFLFIEYASDSGAYLHAYSADKPVATPDDWAWLADCWFRPDAGLVGLEQAVAEAGQKLGAPEREVNVVITMPVPTTPLTEFGRLEGMAQELDFSSEADRQAAMRWYIDRVLGQWQRAGYEHLRLQGLYWTGESIGMPDEELVKWTADYLHGRDLKLYWIPYFGATGLSNWREMGIDATMLQPNYFFQDKPDLHRFLATAQKSTISECGIEIEFDARALTSEDFRERFYAYLDAAIAYGWMGETVLGYYEGGGAIKKFVEGGQQGREMYDALYDFLKGTYKPSGLADFSGLKLVVRDNADNLALASKGAKIHGCLRPEEYPQLAPEKAIDGDIYMYGGMSGFGYFGIPGSLIIELPEVSTVSRTQTMLFESDGRVFRYRIDTSLDNETWQPAVDKSEGEWRGWQVDEFTPREAKYIRFTGLYNSVNPLCQVVEFEVYEKHR